MTERTHLTPSRIFWFWWPLAAMWLMMAMEHPMVAAIALTAAIAAQWGYLWWFSQQLGDQISRGCCSNPLERILRDFY